MINLSDIPEGGYSYKVNCYDVFERCSDSVVNNLTSHHLLCVRMNESVQERLQEVYPGYKVNELEWYFKSEYIAESWH